MIERVLSLAVVAASGVYIANALPLAYGTAARPGPGFFPLAVGVFGGAVALAWTLGAFRRTRAGVGAHAIPADGRGRVAATAATLVAFCLLLPWAGYPAAAFLFAALLLGRLGAGWRPALLIGLASALASYYLFGVLLGVPLPRGVLFD
jgi:putative tricarboxylic transport membrane protein